MAGQRPARGSSTRGARGGSGTGGRGRGARGGRGGRGGRGASSAATASPSDDTSSTAANVNITDAPTTQSSSETVGANASSSSQANPVPSATPSADSARAVPPGGKFLPRAIRRSQHDRENIAAQETAKVEDKAALDARLRRAARGGRGGGRRARGGPPTGFDRIIRGGAGGFGSGIQSSGTRGGSSGGGFGFGRLYDVPSAGGGSSGASSSRAGIKSEGGPTFGQDSSRPTGRRLNTDRIAEFITIDDDDMKSKEGTPILLPKGMIREEPREHDQPEIATTAEVEAAERGEAMIVSSGTSENGDIFYNENEVDMKDDGRRWPGAKEDRRVKIEGEDITEIDMLTRRRAQKKQQLKDEKKKYKYLDEEDRLDAEKMAKQRLLFGIASEDDSDDESKEDKAERKPQIAEGSVYLFQFPPVMPPLHKVERTAAKNPVKDEPNDDVVMLNAPAHDSDKPVDLTKDDIKEEHEDGGPGSSTKGNKKKQPEPEEEPEGFVGKLVIRKSGKMQIDWGGMLFDCEMAIPRGFLREAVLTEDDDEKKPDGYHGTAYGMGVVMGQFNSAPHWSDDKPWIVDPKDLPPWGVGAAPEGMELEQ